MGSLTFLSGIFFVFTCIFCVVKVMFEFINDKRWKIESRLEKIKKIENNTDELEPINLPFKDRIILPVLRKLGNFLTAFTPEQIQKNISDKLAAAGYVSRGAVVNFLAIQAIILLALPFVLAAAGFLMNIGLRLIILYGLAGFLIALLIPVTLLNNKKYKRQSQIKNSLPDVLDLLVVSVEAGLSFDAALEKVIEEFEGILSDELSGVLNEVRMGKTRRMALREMAQRTGVEELISFVSAVFQSDEFGVGIVNVLRTQSEAMRVFRRQAAEEKALKAPVKMLFPLVFCIFPSLFMIILGPSFIQILKWLRE